MKKMNSLVFWPDLRHVILLTYISISGNKRYVKMIGMTKWKFWVPLEVSTQKWVHLAAVPAFGNKPKITNFEAIIAILSSYKALRPPKNSILNYCKGPNDTQATLPYWCCHSWPYQSPKEISIGSSVPLKQLKFIQNMHLNLFVGQLFPPKTWFIALYRWPPYVSSKPILSDICYTKPKNTIDWLTGELKKQ